MVLTRSVAEVAEVFDVPADFEESEVRNRYNIAPSQPVAAIRLESEGVRRYAPLHWGLIPSWVKSREGFRLLINARSETASVKPSFKEAFKKRRCLIPLDGFYEWKRFSEDEPEANSNRRRPSQPYYFRSAQAEMMAVAGIWESWVDSRTGEVVESCALLTTAANETVRLVHHRMPVLIEPKEWRTWLDPELEEGEGLARLLAPAPVGLLESLQVSTHVNNVRHNDIRCIEAVG
ncbi:MAG: hypothetical protein CL917_06610 [Deltaproteobacteria bacterium]|nr:hypothetical protein [Deltaproteobacteria bacterium]